MRAGAVLWPMIGALLLLPSGDLAQDALEEEGREVTPEARLAIKKGIHWLLENQNPDGSWGCQKHQPPSVALTSLAVLVMMADGSTPERGRHSKQIRESLAWIDRHKGRGGILSAHDSTAMGEVFEHASASLMYATMYGMARRSDDYDRDEDLRMKDILTDALEKLEGLQLEDGGWGKNRGGSSDPGVSAMAYLAIRTGYSCGINRDRADLEKLKAYGRRLIGGRPQLYPLACSLRLFAGQKIREESMPKAVAELLTRKLGQDYGQMSEWDYMAAFYSVGALIHDDTSEAWKRWFAYVRDFLVRIQQPDGSWIVEYCLHCKVFATALSLLTLQMPGRYHPSTQY